MKINKFKVKAKKNTNIKSDAEATLALTGSINKLVKHTNSDIANLRNQLAMTRQLLGSLQDEPFITTWNTNLTGTLFSSTVSSAVNQIALPLVYHGEYNFVVNWGDGKISKITEYNSPETVHTYASPGIYTVTITGILKGWNFFYTENYIDSKKLLTIEQWGKMQFESPDKNIYQSRYFLGCTNLTMTTTTDVPDLRGVKSLNRLFNSCSSLAVVNNIESWDVSNVEVLSGIFFGEYISKHPFAGDLSSWNVGNCSDFVHMCRNSNVNFNASNWDMRKAISIGFMFNYTPFNNAGSPDINNWQFENLVSVDSPFRGSPFNQPIGNWNMSKVTTIRSMFRDCPFNQDISAWDTSSVTQAPDTFLGCPFSQDISTWDFSKFTNMSRFLNGSSFGTSNYDKLLLALAASPTLVNFVFMSTGPKYTTDGTGNIETDPAAARQYIINTYNWTISDGGLLVV